MPTGVYLRTEKHSFNKGRKHPNRKRYAKGITPIHKECQFCKEPFVTNCFMPNKKFCSLSCSAKNRVQPSGWKQSEKQKEMMRAKTGDNHPRWIKDRTKLKDDHRDRGGSLHREWSRRVKERDVWKCCMSNTDCKGRTESHHILSWKEYPELRYEVNNGITLCHFHHPRKREDEIKLATYFQELLTPI